MCMTVTAPRTARAAVAAATTGAGRLVSLDAVRGLGQNIVGVLAQTTPESLQALWGWIWQVLYFGGVFTLGQDGPPERLGASTALAGVRRRHLDPTCRA